MRKKWLAIFLCFAFPFVFIAHACAENDPSRIFYDVKKGDTLWAIAQKYRVSVAQLKYANSLSGNLIYPGDQLTIPRADTLVAQVSEEDLEWLVKIIEAEAGGESYEGKVAVGSVVLNRVAHKDYPDSITEVVFQKVNGVYQFSPVGDGRIYTVIPSADSWRAAREALRGADPTDGALFFYNPKTAKSNWIRTRVVVAEIGQHHFAH